VEPNHFVGIYGISAVPWHHMHKQWQQCSRAEAGLVSHSISSTPMSHLKYVAHRDITFSDK